MNRPHGRRRLRRLQLRVHRKRSHTLGSLFSTMKWSLNMGHHQVRFTARPNSPQVNLQDLPMTAMAMVPHSQWYDPGPSWLLRSTFKRTRVMKGRPFFGLPPLVHPAARPAFGNSGGPAGSPCPQAPRRGLATCCVFRFVVCCGWGSRREPQAPLLIAQKPPPQNPDGNRQLRPRS